ncbi:hypothetical protein LCGC14_1499180 [marine sediment metagenome]|uniref:Uncharacterized protein n=1 Tax=marine sediment metagenome TaxID=412755 RepID=A0A0F9LK69_9ZZZZ
MSVISSMVSSDFKGKRFPIARVLTSSGGTKVTDKEWNKWMGKGGKLDKLSAEMTMIYKDLKQAVKSARSTDTKLGKIYNMLRIKRR